MQRFAVALGFTQAETVIGKLVTAGIAPVSMKWVVPSNCRFCPREPLSQMAVPAIVPSFPLVLISVAVEPCTCVRGQKPTHEELMAWLFSSRTGGDVGLFGKAIYNLPPK
jgi:hypothetical protein